MRAILLAVIALVLFATFAAAGTAAGRAPGEAALSPSQAAFLKAESRRIEDNFVARVAAIARTEPERVRRALPDERRITVAVPRLIAALERDLGAPLSDEQKAAIFEADAYRRDSLARIREGASLR